MKLAGIVIASLLVGCGPNASPPGELVVENSRVSRFRVDDNQVYWIDALEAPVLYRGPLGEPLQRPSLREVAIASTVDGVAALEIDANNIYVGARDGITMLGKTSLPAGPLITGTPTPKLIESDDSTLAWSFNNAGESLFWRSLDGGPTTAITLPNTPDQLIVTPELVYVGTSTGVYEVDRASRVVTMIADSNNYLTGPPLSNPHLRSRSLALVGDRLIWMVQVTNLYDGPVAGTMIEIPLDHLEPRVVRSDLHQPNFLAIDSSGAMYWYETNRERAPVDGQFDRIVRLGPDDSEPVVLVDDLSPSWLEVHGGYLYWSEVRDYGGEIRRIATP